VGRPLVLVVGRTAVHLRRVELPAVMIAELVCSIVEIRRQTRPAVDVVAVQGVRRTVVSDHGHGRVQRRYAVQQVALRDLAARKVVVELRVDLERRLDGGGRSVDLEARQAREEDLGGSRGRSQGQDGQGYGQCQSRDSGFHERTLLGCPQVS
jgi:hypothetical protein